eukprot:gene2218-5229_t
MRTYRNCSFAGAVYTTLQNGRMSTFHSEMCTPQIIFSIPTVLMTSSSTAFSSSLSFSFMRQQRMHYVHRHKWLASIRFATSPWHIYSRHNSPLNTSSILNACWLSSTPGNKEKVDNGNEIQYQSSHTEKQPGHHFHLPAGREENYAQKAKTHSSPASSSHVLRLTGIHQRQYDDKQLRAFKFIPIKGRDTVTAAAVLRLNTIKASAKHHWQREQARLERLRKLKQHHIQRLREGATTTLVSDALPRTEKIMTVPNMLSLYRIVITPVFVAALIGGHPKSACALFATAAISDWLDGAIARAFPSQRSVLGTVVDPFADKFTILSTAATLGYIGTIPAWLAALVLSKDAVMILAGLWIRYASLRAIQPTQVTFDDYFNLKRPTVRVVPSFIAKINTAVQLSLFTYLVAHEAFPSLFLLTEPYTTVAWAITATTTIGAGLTYAQSSTALQYLHKMKN